MDVVANVSNLMTFYSFWYETFLLEHIQTGVPTRLLSRLTKTSQNFDVFRAAQELALNKKKREVNKSSSWLFSALNVLRDNLTLKL